jgi:hypothetical protein
MNQKAYLIILFVLFLTPVILATNQEINIKTLKDHSISVIALKSGSVFERIEGFSYSGKKTGNGNITIKSSFTESKIDIRVILMRDGNSIINERFDEVKIGEPIIINLIPGSVSIINKKEEPVPPPAPPPAPEPTPPPAPLEISTQNNQEQINHTSFLTGFAITNGTISPNVKKIMIYLVIAVVSLVIIAIIVYGTFFFFKRRKRKKDEFSISKYINIKVKEQPDNDEIKEAEKRLKIAQEEIEKINSLLDKRKAIKDAERKLDEDRRALDRLKRH